MTSTPVTASQRSYGAKTVAAGTSAGTGVDNSFSDILKNQKSNGSTEGTADASTPPKTEGKTDKVSRTTGTGRKDSLQTKSEEVTPEEAALEAEKAAAAAAGQMLTQTAEQLGIPEEELLQILDDLSMTPMDLLNAESLQEVVLKAAGETDASSLLTDEQLFETFKSLTEALEGVKAEVAEATGLTMEEVEAAFARATEKPEADVQPEEEMPEPVTEEAELPKRPGMETDVAKLSDTEENSGEGEQIMLERSFAQKEGEAGAEQHFSGRDAAPFTQNLSMQNPVEIMPEISETIGYFDADTEMILNQITDYMKGQIVDGVSELEMQLHPESLGSLHVKLTAKEGLVTAQFTAQNETVKAALESQMIQLKDTFREQGITVEAIEVTVASHKFEQNLSQNGGGMQEHDRQSERPRNRRINLNALAEEEDFTQEERIAAEMLKENGGTVDYTA